MASLSQLTRTSTRSYRRIGRGQGSKRGKTSGRGGKGQTARSGHKIRPALRDIIKKLPKRRGYGKNRGRTVYTMRPRPVAISLAQLERAFGAGSEISRAQLQERGMIAKNQTAKIIGNAIDIKLTIKGLAATAAAQAAIEKAGGSLTA